MFFYSFHMIYLSQTLLPFPFMLIPNDSGLFTSISLDSLAGAFSTFLFLYLQKHNKIPSIRKPTYTPPFRHPKHHVLKSSNVAIALLTVYFASGFWSSFFDDLLYLLCSFTGPISLPMHRSLQVLLAHLMWVITGVKILGLNLTPFFSEDSNWYKSSVKKNWAWWVVGGYYVSSWVFNLSDLLNLWLLPQHLFEQGEGVVSQLISPENNDRVASAVGFLAPCVSAPWWEEVLYRGFMLPVLATSMRMGLWSSVLWSGLIFSAHHMSTTSFIPLAVLGWGWAILYLKSGNLLVTMLIHCLWNSRVFLGSWLGL